MQSNDTCFLLNIFQGFGDNSVPEQAEALPIVATTSSAADTVTSVVTAAELPCIQKDDAGNFNEVNSSMINGNNISLNINDFASILQNLLRSSKNNIAYDKNIIPTFDPAQKNQRIENWIAKVNECAKIYKWTDEQTTHFSLPKLGGHAKKWYEGLKTIMLSWEQWQERLVKAFPSESNYGALLFEMLERRMKIGESADEYYYDKMMLLNSCEISGRQAVDCLVYGIDDRTIRAGASSARFSDSEDLLKFLKDICKESFYRNKRNNNSNSATSNDIVCFKCNKTGHRSSQCRSNRGEITCFNCKEKGHLSNKCTKPIIKCDTCNRFGHKATECFLNKNKTDKKILLTQMSKSDTKYHKDAVINDILKVKCFIDFGSDCTLIRQDIVELHSLPKLQSDLPLIRGFGNSKYTPLGKTRIKLGLGEISAEIDAYIVEGTVLTEPLLVGQNFTERADIVIVKTSDELNILKRDKTKMIPSPTNSELEGLNDKVVLRILTDTVVTNITEISCTDSNNVTGDIFLEDSIRCFGPNDYCVLGGAYTIDSGNCKVLVHNLSGSPLTLKTGSILARGNIMVPLDAGCKGEVEGLCRRITDQEVLKPLTSEDVRINSELTQEQTLLVINLINKYRSCFALTLSEIGCTDITDMQIKVNDESPVVYRPYRLSHSEREKARDMVQDLLKNDIAEESNSPYASPIILVRKKTGDFRLCVDYRALNRKTIKDHYPMPRIDDQLDLLSGNKYFTSLDLASGYYQIPLHPDSKHFTAFITPDGLYQFKKMPFGLVNSPAVFQRMVNKVLGSARFESALAYMDDILIPGNSFEQQLSRIEQTFQLLQKAGLTLNPKKCNFFQEVLEYLGYEISKIGIRPGTEKIKAVSCFPTPTNVHEVRQFIGLASYFRKFIYNFALIGKPLTDLTKKNYPWHWGEEQDKSFNQLKEALTQRPLLTMYNPHKKTCLHTDASKYGLGGILMQKDDDSDALKPIAYFSRKTTPEEQNYHAYELETLAVIASLQRFRVYLLGIDFTLITDCSALRATFTKRDLMPRVARWWIALQEYTFSIEYKPGCAMTHVDALSRNPYPGASNTDIEAIPSILKISCDDWLLSLQLADTELQRICSILKDKVYTDIKENFVLKGERLYRKVGDEIKWVVPKAARFQLCKLNHDDIGHFGIDKTFSKISKDFWFPKMKRFVKKYVKSCLECAFGKEPSGPREGMLHSIHKVDKPFDTVHTDHLGPFVKSSKGNSYLLVLVDAFTKYCLIKPLRNLKTNLTVRSLDEIFTTFSYPTRLISDQGSTFTSKDFEKYCKESHINHILNAVASPRANGQVERYNRTILDALTAYTDKIGEKCWDTVLGRVQWGMNNTLNKGIGKSPSEALFGITLTSQGDNLFADILSETRRIGDVSSVRNEISSHISNDQIAQKKNFDKHRKKARVYNVGDLVKILKPVASNDGKSKKLLPKYTGPFRITRALGNDRYEVSSIPGSSVTSKPYCNTWAADRIQPWISVPVNTDSESNSSNDEQEG